MGVITIFLIWTFYLKCHMMCLSVVVLCYRITCWWLCNKRFCNKKGHYLCQTLYFSIYLYLLQFLLWMSYSSEYRSFPFLIKCITVDFIFLHAIVNEIVVLISLSDILLLVYKTIYFSILILYPYWFYSLTEFVDEF